MAGIIFCLCLNRRAKRVFFSFCLNDGDGLAVYKEQVVAFGVALHEGFFDGDGAARHVLAP